MRSRGWSLVARHFPALIPVAGWLYAVAFFLDHGEWEEAPVPENTEIGPEGIPVPPSPPPPSPLVPAPRARRGLAFLVDFAIFWALGLIPLVGWMLGGIFLALRDAAWCGGRSPGKRLVGLAIVRRDGAPWTGSALSSLQRNLLVAAPLAQFVLIPVEALLSWRGSRRRVGDRWAGTEVVRA